MKKYKVEFGPFKYVAYYITDQTEAEKTCSRLRSAPFEVGGLDIETYAKKKFKQHSRGGLDPHLSRIRLVQIYDGSAVYVFDLKKLDSWECVQKLLKAKRWFAHNAVFEIKFLEHSGLQDLDIGCSLLLSELVYNAENSGRELSEEEEAELEETPERVVSYRKNGHSLKDVCGRLFNVMLDKDEQKSDWGAENLTQAQILYAALDAVVTFHAAKRLGKKVSEYGMKKHYTLIKKAQHVISEMELNGMPVDWEYHKKLIEKWDEKRAEAQRKSYGYFGDTNMNSAPQMNKWLEKYFAREPEILKRWPRTPKGGYSFNQSLISPFKKLEPIKWLIQYKEYQKLVSTYGESLAAQVNPVTKCLHTGFTMGHTKTGRLSSRAPNLQNFPSEEDYRAMFAVPEEDVMIVADFSQIELRIQAEMSRDPVMREVYKKGGDIYLQIAEKFFRCKVDPNTPDGKIKRKFGKVLYLSLGYGMGANKLVFKCHEAEVPLRDEQVVAGHKFYRELHSVYISWCDRSRDTAKQLGYARTLFGKMRRMDPDRVYTTAPNTEIQGTAGELMLLAALAVKKRVGGYASIRNIVHDEIILTCPREMAEQCVTDVRDGMNAAMAYMFPKAASHEVTEPKICSNWGEK